VLEIDQERKRISLSLKLAQPSPWHDVEARFESGQLVLAKITNVVDFGAFAALDEGLEGLVHDSELGPLPPKETVQRGEEVVLRVLYVDAARERIGLSLTRVSDEEKAAFLADLRGEPLEAEADEVVEQAESETASEDEAEAAEPAAAVDEGYWENLVEHQDQEPLVSVE
jgi:small subunit ribosomal protein S1